MFIIILVCTLAAVFVLGVTLDVIDTHYHLKRMSEIRREREYLRALTGTQRAYRAEAFARNNTKG